MNAKKSPLFGTKMKFAIIDKFDTLKKMVYNFLNLTFF
jgi:hypothetical protein